MWNGLGDLLFRQIVEAEEERGRVYEPVIGVVTSNKDPDHLGRVKVKFPSLSMDDDSAWAPIVSMGAGKGRGWFFLPEVDDEVLVMFEHGDISRPLVVGAMWNGKDKPPKDNADGKNTTRGIVSKNGSTILFDDDKGTISITDGGGAGVLTIDKQNKITLEAKQGDVVIACKDDLTIVAKEIEMTATTQMEISSATADVKGGADGKIDLKGAAMLQVQGAQTSLNGGAAQAPQMPQAQPAEVPDEAGKTGSGSSAQSNGGSSAGGGGSSSSSSDPEEPAPSSQDDPGQMNDPPPTIDEHTLEVQVVDSIGNPVPNVYYELALPDGTKKTGTTASDGFIRVSGLKQKGDAQLTFPDIDEPPPGQS
ncbi:MAG TPA: phage baseplate assembly protein V [Kofleriaceae bacterium]|nr:phage baseplate assembly protein V [Kofleriaceae bacterium]